MFKKDKIKTKKGSKKFSRRMAHLLYDERQLKRSGTLEECNLVEGICLGNKPDDAVSIEEASKKIKKVFGKTLEVLNE